MDPCVFKLVLTTMHFFDIDIDLSLEQGTIRLMGCSIDMKNVMFNEN